MARVRVKHIIKGYKDIRRAPGVVGKLESMADGIAGRSNQRINSDGYRTSSRQGRAKPQGRHRTTVITANQEAIRDNMKNNTLIKEMKDG